MYTPTDWALLQAVLQEYNVQCKMQYYRQYYRLTSGHLGLAKAGSPYPCAPHHHLCEPDSNKYCLEPPELNSVSALHKDTHSHTTF